VSVVNGLFTLKLTDASLLTHLGGHEATGVWLELTVDGTTYARQKIEPEAYAILALQADSLSSACAGCVNDSMLTSSGISGSHITTGTVADSARLNGQTASFYQQALSAGANASGTSTIQCSAGDFVSSITHAGAVSCSPAVSSLAVNGSGISVNAASGSVTISVAAGHDGTTRALQSVLLYDSSDSASGNSCAGPRSAISAINGDGSFSCVSEVASADALSCTGCVSSAELGAASVTSGKIADGAVTGGASGVAGHAKIADQTITATQLAAGAVNGPAALTVQTTTASQPFDSSGGPQVSGVCATCPGGTVLTGGSCYLASDPNPTPAPLYYSGPNPIPAGLPAPAAPPPPATASTQWCCIAVEPCCDHSGQLNAVALCLSASVSLP
jgi:hypothetical protein